MIITDIIRANFPFQEVLKPPTKLAIKLQGRIKYMFGITVEPIIIRQPQSYYKTIAFRPLWNLKTEDNKYQIISFEKAVAMSKKSYWQVLDSKLFEIPNGYKQVEDLQSYLMPQQPVVNQE